MNKVQIIAEIGINHNGDLEICKKLIDVAVLSGCNYVKFQKRTPEVCVPEHQKNVQRETPWGTMTYLDYKKKIEFDKKEYDEIDKYCKQKDIGWFASVWDKASVDFMKQYGDIMKIPSALIIDLDLCEYTRKNCDTLIISTGMSTEKEVVDCIDSTKPDVVMHTNSTYPAPVEELSLKYITYLIKKYPKTEIGYSGHEYGLVPTFASVALGATWVERHITLDRTMWGSDQLSSIEPIGFSKLVKGIRDIEKSFGIEGPRKLYNSELTKKKSLRK